MHRNKNTKFRWIRKCFPCLVFFGGLMKNSFFSHISANLHTLKYLVTTSDLWLCVCKRQHNEATTLGCVLSLYSVPGFQGYPTIVEAWNSLGWIRYSLFLSVAEHSWAMWASACTAEEHGLCFLCYFSSAWCLNISTSNAVCPFHSPSWNFYEWGDSFKGIQRKGI